MPLSCSSHWGMQMAQPGSIPDLFQPLASVLAEDSPRAAQRCCSPISDPLPTSHLERKEADGNDQGLCTMQGPHSASIPYLSCLGSQSRPGSSSRAACRMSPLSTVRLRRCSA